MLVLSYWFWQKSGLEYTKYSIFLNVFREEPPTLPMDKGH